MNLDFANLSMEDQICAGLSFFMDGKRLGIKRIIRFNLSLVMVGVNTLSDY